MTASSVQLWAELSLPSTSRPPWSGVLCAFLATGFNFMEEFAGIPGGRGNRVCGLMAGNG